MSATSLRIADHFASLTDPRRKNITHPLINLVTIALCGSIAGADDFVTMIDWAHHHQNWLAQFLNLSYSLPSHDTLSNRSWRFTTCALRFERLGTPRK